MKPASALLDLLAALLVVVGIAWACAVWSPSGPPNQIAPASAWRMPSPPGWPPNPDNASEQIGLGLVYECSERDGEFQQAVLMAGWPFLALKAGTNTLQSDLSRGMPILAPTLRVPPHPGAKDPSAVRAPPWGYWHPEGGFGFQLPGQALDIPRCLPAVPMWGGLLANTLIFFLAIQLARLVAWRCRRRIRLSRNQCPHCKYMLGDARICTECGWR